MTTYTIADFRSDEVRSGLSASDAATELLTHDGAEYEIRPFYENLNYERNFLDSLEEAEAARDERIEEAIEDNASEREISGLREMWEPELGGYALWHRKPNAGRSKWNRTVIYSDEVSREVAENDIFTKVIMSGHWDRDDLFVGTDEAYAEMIAEQADE